MRARVESRDHKREIEHDGCRDAEHDECAQDLRGIVDRKGAGLTDRIAMCHELVMRLLEVLHVRFHEAHVRRRLVVDAQQVDADVALLVRIGPALDSRVDLELRLLVLRDGVEPGDVVVAEPLRELLHAILLVELQLGDGLDEAEVDAARLHLVNRRLQGLRRTERLLAGEDDLRHIEAIEAREDSLDVVRGAVLVVARAREDVEARIVDGLHLVSRHAEVHLEEGIVVRLDGEDFLPADLQGRHAVAAEAAQEIFLDFSIGLWIVTDDVDFLAVNLARGHELAPGRVLERPSMVTLEDLAAVDCRSLAVVVELLEGCLVDSQRSDTRLFRLLEHDALRQSLALRKLLQSLVIDGEVDLAVRALHSMALEADDQCRQEADHDDQHEPAIVLESLHLIHLISKTIILHQHGR